MRKGLNEAYDHIKQEGELTAPLPQHRVDDIEVFAESVHAILHEHDWKVVNTMNSITSPFRIDVIFQCKSCNEVIRKQAERPLY